jgi:hypothetical protein
MENGFRSGVIHRVDWGYEMKKCSGAIHRVVLRYEMKKCSGAIHRVVFRACAEPIDVESGE